MPIVTIEKPLREKLGDEASDSLIRLINQSQTEQKNDVLEFVEEKFERRLSEEMSKVNYRISQVNERLTEEIGKVNERLTEEIGKVNQRINEVEGGLLAKISETKSDMIKWMFIFWVGQVGVILGILFAFFK